MNRTERRLQWYRLARNPQPHRRQDLEASLLNDRCARVRAAAAYALKALASTESIPTLTRALNDPDFNVRSQAGWALVELGDAARPQAWRVLREGNEDAQEMARLVLARLADSSPRWILLAASMG